MLFRGVDWLGFWKYDHTRFFWAYAFFGVLIRLLFARRTTQSGWIIAWLVGSAASLIAFPFMPFLCIPAYLIVMLLTGRTVSESLFMAVPITASIAGCITILDAGLVRLLSHKKLCKGQVWFFFRINALIAGLAIVVVITLELIHPTEVIAVVLQLAIMDGPPW